MANGGAGHGTRDAAEREEAAGHESCVCVCVSVCLSVCLSARLANGLPLHFIWFQIHLYFDKA